MEMIQKVVNVDRQQLVTFFANDLLRKTDEHDNLTTSAISDEIGNI